MIPAADDFEMIRKRMSELAEERMPMCPTYPAHQLHNCLRTPVKCPPSCPYVNDWTGPE